MFDVGWPELLVIAIVLIVVVGPEDLPRMLRAFGKATTRMRSMASEFRTQFDEALKEADLDDVRKTISDAQKLNPTKSLRDAMNPLRQVGEDIRSGLNDAVRPGSISKPDETLPTTDPVKPSMDIGAPAPSLNGSTQATAKTNGASAEPAPVPKTRKAVGSKTATSTKAAVSAKKTSTLVPGNGKAAKPAAKASVRKPAKATASKPADAKIAPAPASGASGKAPAPRSRKTAAAGKSAPAGKPAPRKAGRKSADEADT